MYKATRSYVFVGIPSEADPLALQGVAGSEMRDANVRLVWHPSLPWLCLQQADEGVARALAQRFQTRAFFLWYRCDYDDASIRPPNLGVVAAQFDGERLTRRVSVDGNGPWSAQGEPQLWEKVLFPDEQEIARLQQKIVDDGENIQLIEQSDYDSDDDFVSVIRGEENELDERRRLLAYAMAGQIEAGRRFPILPPY